MRKRTAVKVEKRAKEKVLAREPLSNLERKQFKKYMESWFGPEITTRIKRLGKAEM